MVEQKIYRDCGKLGWRNTIMDFINALTTRGDGRHVSLVGKHGFGKSTVLETLAKYDKSSLIIEGDMLYQVMYAMAKKLPPETRLDASQAKESIGMVWDVPSSEVHEMEAWFISNGWFDRVDLVTNWSHAAAETWMVVPDHTFYEKNLKARTAAMLKEPLWQGSTADRWPVLSFEQLRTWEVEAWTKFTNPTGCLPNLGRDSDVIWKAWWDTTKRRLDDSKRR